tara:strand:+ start:354 stop:632 length:279 start_codon:yes stop_codon:yes gene_type:complete
MRYFNDELLPHYRNNNLSKSDKLQIINDLWEDYKNGLLDQEVIKWIVDNDRFGHFTCSLIVEDMLRKKIIKKDFTGRTSQKTYEQKKNPFIL